MTATWAVALVGGVGVVVTNAAWLYGKKRQGDHESPDRRNLVWVFALKLFVDLITLAGIVALIYFVTIESH